MKYIYLKIIIIYIILSTNGCNNHEVENDISPPDYINQIEGLDVYSPDIQSSDTVELIKKMIFESNEDVFMAGYINKMAIDDSDRVYIGSNNADRGGVYVFNPDGNFLTTIGKIGRGPGEFGGIGSIDVWDDQLYLFDPVHQKIIVFSLDNYELIDEALISREKIGGSDPVNMMRGANLFVINDGNLLLSFSRWSVQREDDIRKILYYPLADDGILLPENILEMKRFPFYFPKANDGIELPFTMPFTRSSLVTFGEENFYTAWTEDFLIKVYDKEGNYNRAFYYPIEKSPLSLNELGINRERQRVLDRYELPEDWPALHTMELDDEGRLWVATITDSDTSFTWWVLDQEGKLITQFLLPGNRSARSVMSESLIKIKNGYFYIHEVDYEEGVDRIIKYKFFFRTN